MTHAEPLDKSTSENLELQDIHLEAEDLKDILAYSPELLSAANRLAFLRSTNNYANDMKQFEKYVYLIRKFANIEQLAHGLAYKKQIHDKDHKSKFTQISVMQDDNTPTLATVYPVHTSYKGLICTILEIPSNKPSEPHKIEVLWRGTHDKNSAKMDLDPNSPGYLAYQHERDAVLTAVSSSIKRLTDTSKEKGIAIGSYGHSLGGNLAQLFATDILDVITRNHFENSKTKNTNVNNNQKFREQLADYSQSIDFPIINQGNQIKQLTIGTFNSAGTSIDTYNRAKAFEDYLHKNFNEHERPEIKCFFGLSSQDFVQKTGDATILADSTKTPVYLFKDKGHHVEKKHSIFSKVGQGVLQGITLGIVSAKRTKKAHTKKHFIGEAEIHKKSLKFQIYDNSLPEEQQYISKELNKKSKLLKTSGIKKIQAKLYYLLQPKNEIASEVEVKEAPLPVMFKGFQPSTGNKKNSKPNTKNKT